MESTMTLIESRIGYNGQKCVMNHCVAPHPTTVRERHERAAYCTTSAAKGVDFAATNFVVDTTSDRCPWTSTST